MNPARLAAHHRDRARYFRRYDVPETARFHLAAALLIIARCSGGHVRREAADLLKRVTA